MNAAALLCLSLGLLGPAADLCAQQRKNYYDDPFVQVTSAVPGCPVPEGPLITLDEMRAQGHGRVDRGTTCFRSGRCRLPNSYLYDKEIIPRVKTHIDQDERFANTSVWIVGSRRWVHLMGCVASEQQSDALERAVRGVDDVEAVINELMIGSDGKPRYRTVASP
jgi:BON domain